MNGVPNPGKQFLAGTKGLGAHSNVGVIRRACESCTISRSVRVGAEIGLCNNCPFTAVVAPRASASGAGSGRGAAR